jgi:hypothetical protein
LRFSLKAINPIAGSDVEFAAGQFADHQIRLYFTFRQTDGPVIATVKASISTATAYGAEQHHQLPLDAAEEKPSEETETQRPPKAPIGPLDQQQGTPQPSEKGMQVAVGALVKAADLTCDAFR